MMKSPQRLESLMDKMVKEMCEAIANNTIFTADDIYAEWESYHSFDVILRAVNYAEAFGIANIHQATNVLLAEYIQVQRGL